MFSIINTEEEEVAPSQSIEQPANPPPNRSSTTPGWCSCGNCRLMVQPEEDVCCGQLPDNCTSRWADFELLVLEPAVVTLAVRHRNDVFAINSADESDHMRTMRHGAYRQYMLWTYGYLGRGNRRVIPSCCVWRIRDKYPSPFGQYSGYQPSRLV